MLTMPKNSNDKQSFNPSAYFSKLFTSADSLSENENPRPASREYFSAEQHHRKLLQRIRSHEESLAISFPHITTPLTPSEQAFLASHTLSNIAPPQPVTLSLSAELIAATGDVFVNQAVRQAFQDKGPLAPKEIEASSNQATATASPQADSPRDVVLNPASPGTLNQQGLDTTEIHSNNPPMTTIEHEHLLEKHPFTTNHVNELGCVNPNELMSNLESFRDNMLEGAAVSFSDQHFEEQASRASVDARNMATRKVIKEQRAAVHAVEKEAGKLAKADERALRRDIRASGKPHIETAGNQAANKMYTKGWFSRLGLRGYSLFQDPIATIGEEVVQTGIRQANINASCTAMLSKFASAVIGVIGFADTAHAPGSNNNPAQFNPPPTQPKPK